MVHDVWSTMFNQCCKTVFFNINFKIKGLGNAMVPPFGENTATIYKYNITYHVTYQEYITGFRNLSPSPKQFFQVIKLGRVMK